MTSPRLSALVVVHNEEARLAACLERLRFADEIVVVLDRCTDGSRAVAEAFGARLLEGAWAREGDRRNAGIALAAGPWILEVDADEHVPPDLAAEIRTVIAHSAWQWHEIPVNNYVGARLVRHGWGPYIGKAAYPGLFRKGAKTWGPQRVHPALRWEGRKGPSLRHGIDHYVDRDISDMLQRLDRYTTLHAADLRDRGEPGTLARNARRMLSRFYKCYIRRRGYREGGLGLLIACCAGLYPLLSHLKAKLEP